jgi:hypothetical protein
MLVQLVAKKVGFSMVLALLGFGLAWAPARSAARSARGVSSYALAEGTNEFGLWAGGAPDSVDFVGNSENRKLFLSGLRYGRIFKAWESMSLEYTFDVIPAALVFMPDSARGTRSTIYGAGVSPLGIKLNFGQDTRIKPFVAASAGFVYFQDDVPVRGSSRFNFTPELGFGLQFFMTPKNAVTLGYKLQHISNAGIGRRNPGMDSHLIYAGFSFFTP